jgi:hypothetical protein
MDEIAKLYVRFPDGRVYRIKIFEKTVGVERQRPQYGDNILLSKEGDDGQHAAHVYDAETGIWDIYSLQQLVALYETVLLRYANMT